ncbi:type IV toxin-antitoxin system AbiEi family antitoxin domain-containing protein [Agromyces tropicus]|uniref:Type IV toxin-antitoxin system AbiEi family antitoxin domain-containing protein n=1 Tax=Agromyces tropicus TaxID=555371 RepID=A0ABP5G8K4_9MICO
MPIVTNPDPSPVDAVAELGGIASREQLMAAGVRGPAISVAVRLGAMRRIRRAHYALPDADRSAVAAVRLGGRLGCVSATSSHGLWTPTPRHVHVALAVNAARLRTNRVLVQSGEPLTPDRMPLEVRLHWSDVPYGERADESAWRVPVARALVQVARCCDRREVAAVFESAITSGFIDTSAAQRLLDASAPARLGRVRLRGMDGSGVETYLALELLELGVPFIQQVPFDGVGLVDFLVAGRLAVEVDGYRFHSGRDAFSRDRRRDEVLLHRGIPTLRLAAEDVLTDPRAAALRVVSALAAID